MRTFSPSLAFLVALALPLTAVRPAAAYVWSVSSRCNPLHWAQTCVIVTSDSAGVPDMPFADVERVVGEAVQSWSDGGDGTSFLQMTYLAAAGPRETTLDGWQVVKFRTVTWCRPADASGAEVCYDPGSAALTTVSFVSDSEDPTNDGRILDADIELNAVNNYFYDAGPVGDAGTNRPPPADPAPRTPLDLWDTLSHELGHLQGLDHTCTGWPGTDLPSCSRDGSGQPVIACSVVEAGHTTDPLLAAIYATTMYPSAKANDILKRIPKTDDRAGIAALYPVARDPMLCEPAGTNGPPVPAASTPPPPTAGQQTSARRGCATAPGPAAPSDAGTWIGLALLGALGVVRQRRARDLPRG
jgi:MYXO-CTERM domain-containing protein